MSQWARTGICLVVASSVTLPALAAGSRRVDLPSAEETIRSRLRAEQLLRGGRGPERTLPGAVTDRERVEVAIAPDGTPQTVFVEQRLSLHGVGDFFVKIPGPVKDVEALPGSTSEPGLRSGSIVWQGFATRGETLGARAELDPEHEVTRLPVGLQIEAKVDGRSIDLSEEITGKLSLTITLTNNTGVTLSLPSADASAMLVATLLDRARATLARGERPEPGARGLPRFVPATSPVDRVERSVAAPLQVRLQMSLGGGAPVSREVVLSGRRVAHTLRLHAPLSAGRLELMMTVAPSAPAPSGLRPPGSPDWEVAAAEGRVDGREMLDRLVYVLAEAARLPDIDGYLGNPDRDGPTMTTYHYMLVEADTQSVARPTPPPADEPTSVLRIVLAVALMLLTLAGLTIWWASS